MQSNRLAILGLFVLPTFLWLAGCAKDDASIPAVHSQDLGDASKGEVLVPYPSGTTGTSKLLNDPSQYPMPPLPASVTAQPASPAGPTGDEYTTPAKQTRNRPVQGFLRQGRRPF